MTDDELLAVAGFAFFPFATAALGPDASPGGDRFEVGLWLAPPTAADRDALVLRLPVGAAAGVVCRPASGPDHPDIVPCVAAATRAYLVPLLVDLVAGLDPVEAALDRDVAALGGTVGELLDGVLLTRPARGRPVPPRPRGARGRPICWTACSSWPSASPSGSPRPSALPRCSPSPCRCSSSRMA